MTIWVFIVVFPVLMGGPVTVRVESASAEQCRDVRKLLANQLDQHRSNASVTPCTIAVPTVVPPSP